MNREHILQFLNDNPVFFLATCHGGLPHVRTMRLLRADEHGIYFSTARNKALHRQLKANPAVEMCFYSPGDGLQIRITGKVGVVTDLVFRRELADRVPAMSSFVLDDGPSGVAVFCLQTGRVTIWKEEDFALRRLTGFELSSIWMAICDGRSKTSVADLMADAFPVIGQ
jgi:pyridoxamine 5'-phosphate oxidase